MENGDAPIRYTRAPCFLGRVLLAGTERGLCFLGLGDTDAELEAALEAEFPRASLRPDAIGLRAWRDAVLRYLERGSGLGALPLDVSGTEFQEEVWEGLREIPPGETRGYGELARSIGRSAGAARAVGRACATNPVSLAVPCHRVVRADGAAGSYRWSGARKRALLALEERAAA